MRILITGAAGNLGGLLARHLLPAGHALRLMFHHTPLPRDLACAPGVTAVHADLARPESLTRAVHEVDVTVHFAGRLFAPWPERFLPETNLRWFANLLDASLQSGLRRMILISFPHVEGPTTVDRPATGRLDRRPLSVHARTRLEQERLLLARTRDTQTTPVVLRSGMIYGDGILMIDAARWLARRRLLGVWPDPTWIQLISTIDFLRATTAAVVRPGVEGIYHLGDDRPVTLQQFLDRACELWNCPSPRRLPPSLIFTAAGLCELLAWLTRRPSPLTRDFIRIGRVSYWGDTRRAREELISDLVYPTLEDGAITLR